MYMIFNPKPNEFNLLKEFILNTSTENMYLSIDMFSGTSDVYTVNLDWLNSEHFVMV